jgi:hypothetical protein
VFVDGKSVMIEQGAALIQACEKAGADVSVDTGKLPCAHSDLCYQTRFLASVIMVMTPLDTQFTAKLSVLTINCSFFRASLCCW